MNFTRNKNMFLCQSCAGKIKKEKDFGTEKDGTRSKVYCRYCYKNGKWRLFLLR
ncbi:zinc ribbon domain-containing protein [Lactococcus garvieae]|uniref:zinc ribbon domain-containing protein n=1 Tax=Lactococcus garvieae TaxID=1363 RepID=UPI0030B9B493